MGRLGRTHFRRLQAVGLLPATVDGFADDELLARGVGFTDIVKRPTARARELTGSEYAVGARLLRAKLERYRPRVAIFTFKKPAELLLGAFAGHGERPSPFEATRCFVMPGPYARREAADRALGALGELVAATN